MGLSVLRHYAWRVYVTDVRGSWRGYTDVINAPEMPLGFNKSRRLNFSATKAYAKQQKTKLLTERIYISLVTYNSAVVVPLVMYTEFRTISTFNMKMVLYRDRHATMSIVMLT